MNLDFDNLLLLRSALDTAIRYENDTYGCSIYTDLYIELKSLIERFIKQKYDEQNIPF